ncbi:phage tail tube protein [Streptomyces sp. CC208A]|uniref:phage tail tube protein n=1 Tax=Streptomyces sp. CC208A TaxID=3044573 RepID=UPI0024A98062|nr:phage tail tube protein [Streptomyces sp. CC208A]
MSTPTPVTALARRWRLEIDMSAAKDGSDWQMVPGITEFNPAAEPNIEDSSSYDSDGWAENTKTGQSWELGVTINRKINDQVKVYHPTHEAFRAAAFAFGSASEVHVRYFDRNGLPEAYEGIALVTWAPSGGEYTALDQVEMTLTGHGPLAQITNPAA